MSVGRKEVRESRGTRRKERRAGDGEETEGRELACERQLDPREPFRPAAARGPGEGTDSGLGLIGLVRAEPRDDRALHVRVAEGMRPEQLRRRLGPGGCVPRLLEREPISE